MYCCIKACASKAVVHLERERERERETHKEEEEKDYLGQQREMEEEKEGGMFQNKKIKKKEIWKGEKEKIKSEN